MKVTTLILLLATSTFLQLGCDELSNDIKAPKDTIGVMISMDISDSPNQDRYPTADELYNYILVITGLDKRQNYFAPGILVSFSVIGEELQPQISQVLLEPGTNWFIDNTRTRHRQVKAFLVSLREQVDRFINQPKDHQATNIASSLSYQFEVIKEASFSDSTFVLILTDGLQVGQGLNMEKLNGSPSDSIAFQQLQQLCSFGDLSGFNVTLLSSPIADRRVITNRALHNWTDILESSGARARIRSNLITEAHVADL